MSAIPVTLISDKKLAFSVATTIVNLMETKKPETIYDFWVIVTPDFEKDDELKIKSLAEKYSGCSVQFIHADDRFMNAKNNTLYISNACAYKFCLAEFLPQFDKVLYLDTDILVFDDLSSLYEIDIKDNYIGGVFSVSHCISERLKITLDLPDLFNYVNAGVLLFNLKEIRKDNIIPKCVELIGCYEGSVDQHIYNKVCYGRIAMIPPKYNLTRSNDKLYKTDFIYIGFTHTEVKELENPVIYHYTGQTKPWNTMGVKYGRIWIKYYELTPYGDVPLDLNYDYIRQYFDAPLSYSRWDRIFSVKFRRKNGFKYIIITFFGYVKMFKKPDDTSSREKI